MPDLADLRQQGQRVLLIVGPEGGFTEVERHEAMEGESPSGLAPGRGLLRIEETAALATATVFLCPGGTSS